MKKIIGIKKLKTKLRSEICDRERKMASAGSCGTDAEKTRDIFIKRGTIRGLELALSYVTGKTPDFIAVETDSPRKILSGKGRYLVSGRKIRTCKKCGMRGHDVRNCTR